MNNKDYQLILSHIDVALDPFASIKERKDALKEIDNVLSSVAICFEQDYSWDPMGEARETAMQKGTSEIVNAFLKYIDSKPSSGIHKIAIPVRVSIIRHSGLICDNYERLILRSNVRSNNWRNITILTGGLPYYLHGERGTVWLDARERILIFGPGFIGSRCGVYTHTHNFKNPLASMYDVPSRQYSPAIIFPDVVIFENVNVFGVVNTKSLIMSNSVLPRKPDMPPYSLIGGIGRECRVVDSNTLPPTFPPKYLVDLLQTLNQTTSEGAAFLSRYYAVVSKYVEEIKERAAYPLKKTETNRKSHIWKEVCLQYSWAPIDSLPSTIDQ